MTILKNTYKVYLVIKTFDSETNTKANIHVHLQCTLYVH